MSTVIQITANIDQKLSYARHANLLTEKQIDDFYAVRDRIAEPFPPSPGQIRELENLLQKLENLLSKKEIK